MNTTPAGVICFGAAVVRWRCKTSAAPTVCGRKMEGREMPRKGIPAVQAGDRSAELSWWRLREVICLEALEDLY